MQIKVRWRDPLTLTHVGKSLLGWLSPIAHVLRPLPQAGPVEFTTCPHLLLDLHSRMHREECLEGSPDASGYPSPPEPLLNAPPLVSSETDLCPYLCPSTPVMVSASLTTLVLFQGCIWSLSPLHGTACFLLGLINTHHRRKELISQPSNSMFIYVIPRKLQAPHVLRMILFVIEESR